MTMQTCDNPQRRGILSGRAARIVRRVSLLALGGIGSMLIFSASANSNPAIVLHLPDGDRVTGVIISSNASGIVLATAWGGNVTVPAAQIISRTESSGELAATNLTTALHLGAAQPATNQTPRRWKAEAQVGLDFAYGLRSHQIYYGRLRLDYKKPYVRDPRQSFRNTADAILEYGETDGYRSSDRLDGGVDTQFDLSPRFYTYNIARGGYDQIRKIELQYEVGPGLGHHLVQTTNFNANISTGINYLRRIQTGGTEDENLFARVAEDFRWQISHRLTFDQKLEYFVGAEQAHARFEAGLKFFLLQNVSLNLTVLDLFDTRPAENVDQNELRIRSSLGVTF
jgi:putative salt-induced outer membrane protein YdiY